MMITIVQRYRRCFLPFVVASLALLGAGIAMLLP